MLNNATTLETSELMSTLDSIMLASFMEKGYTRKEFNGRVSVDIVRLSAILGQILKENKVISSGFMYHLADDCGVMYFNSLTEGDGFTEYNMVVISTITLTNAIGHELDKVLYTKPYTGVFDIHIYHKFLVGDDNIANCYINRDTDSFKYLLDSLYPKIDVPNMVNQYLESNETILLMSGLPGVGKTCMTKLIMREMSLHKGCDIDVIYVKDPDILAKDSFWASMTSTEPALLIMDDMDRELLPRTEGTNPIVSNMLSFSDGIFDVKTKIIITTNLVNNVVDPAIVRPGRCFEAIQIPQLTREEALTVWIDSFKSDSESFNTIFGKASTISQAHLSSEYARHIKNDSPTYLLDPSISVRRIVEEGGSLN